MLVELGCNNAGQGGTTSASDSASFPGNAGGWDADAGNVGGSICPASDNRAFGTATGVLLNAGVEFYNVSNVGCYGACTYLASGIGTGAGSFVLASGIATAEATVFLETTQQGYNTCVEAIWPQIPAEADRLPVFLVSAGIGEQRIAGLIAVADGLESGRYQIINSYNGFADRFQATEATNQYTLDVPVNGNGEGAISLSAFIVPNSSSVSGDIAGAGTDYGDGVVDHYDLAYLESIYAAADVVYRPDADFDGDLDVDFDDYWDFWTSHYYSSPDACLADVNADGTLSPAEYNAWILAFNAGLPKADQNGDGALTPADFNAWVLNEGTGDNVGC